MTALDLRSANRWREHSAPGHELREFWPPTFRDWLMAMWTCWRSREHVWDDAGRRCTRCNREIR